MLAGAMHKHCQGEVDKPNEAVWGEVQRSRGHAEKYLQFYWGSAGEV